MITKTKSQHALTAQAIRKELKLHFPLIKFSVKSDSFAGGNSVRVEWNNGPTYEKVEALVGKYQYGRFDGMQDLYEYNNSRSDIPQVKYVQVQRTITKDIIDIAFEDGKNYFSDWENVKGMDYCVRDKMGRLYTPSQEIWRILSRQDLSKGYNKEMLFNN
jgi:hypothetical protein